MGTYTRQLVAVCGAAWGGLTGVGYTVKDTAGSTLVGLTTAGITEEPTGSGTYLASATFDDVWAGRIVWSIPGLTAAPVEDFGPRTVRLDWAQAVPTTNTGQTLGDALNAARAQGFGKWVLSGTTLTLYAADGTTAVRSFTLDNSTSPTQRT